MIRRTSLLLSALLMAGCPPKDDDKVDTGDSDTDDPIGDTGEVDTNGSIEDTNDTSSTAAGTLALIPDIRRSALLSTYTAGQLLRVEGAVVVAVRDFTANDNGFVVQDGTSGSNGGIYVDAGSSIDLPAIGDVVTVVGAYGEDDLGSAGAPSPSQTRTELALGGAPSGWTMTGTTAVPTALDLDVVDIVGGAEVYESMVASVDDGGDPLEVVSWDAAGNMVLDADGTTVRVRADFFTDRTAPIDYGIATLAAGDSFTSVSGVVHWTSAGFAVTPISAGDLAGYAMGVVDTGEPPDDTGNDDTAPTGTTDTGPTGTTDTGPTGQVDTAEDSDTFIGFETADTGGPTGPRDAEVNEARAAIFAEGTYLSFDGLTVTAVRNLGAASKYATVQDPTLTEDAGLTVVFGNAVALPSIGDSIDITGRYQETPTTGTRPYATSLEIYVLDSDPMATWATVGVGVAPTPVALTHADVFAASCIPQKGGCMPETIEKYESMVVRMEDPGQTYGISRIVGTLGTELEVGTGSDDVNTTYWFYNWNDAYNVSTGDTLDAIEGPLYFQVNAYKPGVASAAGLINYVDN